MSQHSTIKTIKTCFKKIPFSKCIWDEIKRIILARRLRPLLIALYPVATDKALVRFGPAGDGGYLVPEDLEGIAACFSPGVNLISGFETDCANRGIKAYLADASVDGPTESHELFEFKKLFIGHSEQDNFITLDDWITQSIKDDQSDLLLQMDIEGAEYEALDGLSEHYLKQFRIMVIEFHGMQHLTSKQAQVFFKILKHHVCVHIHPNNYEDLIQIRDLSIPPVIECTFIRKDRIQHQEFQTLFPHPLDCDNGDRPPFELPKCWYSQTPDTTTTQSA